MLNKGLAPELLNLIKQELQEPMQFVFARLIRWHLARKALSLDTLMSLKSSCRFRTLSKLQSCKAKNTPPTFRWGRRCDFHTLHHNNTAMQVSFSLRCSSSRLRGAWLGRTGVVAVFFTIVPFPHGFSWCLMFAPMLFHMASSVFQCVSPCVSHFTTGANCVRQSSLFKLHANSPCEFQLNH